MPGERIKDELKARGWTQTDLAEIIGRPLQMVNEIIAGKKAITAETAVQLGIAFGTGPDLWMQLESSYRLSLVHDSEDEVSRRVRLYEMAPIKDMEKRNWIGKARHAGNLERELCKFFGVQSLDRPPEIDAMPRKSSADLSLSPSQRAWCFRAKQLAAGLQAKPYDPKNLDAGIARLRELAAYPEETRRVPRVLAGMGIRFVVIEPLPKTRIDGVAFWLSPDSPVIALSLRYDRIDSFWHTLGHELSHVRHQDAALVDTDIVGEDRPSPAEQTAVERRADREAAAAWIDPPDLESFIARVGPLYSKKRINQFANRIRIHPGIILGQLQHRGEIRYSSNREMLVKVRENLTREALTDGWGYSMGKTP